MTRSLQYRVAGVVLGLLSIVCVSITLALPTWFDADVPQDGEKRNGHAGLFQFCLNEEDESKVETADCRTAKWQRESIEDDEEKNAQVIRRMFAQLIAARIAQLVGGLIMFALIVRYACTSSRHGALVDTLIAASLFALVNLLFVEMRTHPHEVLRMYDLLGALDYNEDDQNNLIGDDVKPELRFGSSWIIGWLIVVLVVWTGVALHLSRKHAVLDLHT
eukprot:gb/GECG01011820.1/.p1 GENE.gb/GECG01011820.1/~~gb/GECG01011820.1/.p1  ORF type:complete len:219 (+),score=19.45 gb/GECG01011820.1/:1-657(+)